MQAADGDGGTGPRLRARKTGAGRQGAPIAQLPWKQPRNRYPVVNLLSADEIEAIHAASLRVLEEVGLNIHHAEGFELFRRAGASVDAETRRVRIGRDIVEAALASVPATVTLGTRNPDRSIIVGGDHLCFTTVLGPPYCSDIVRGRRPGTLADYSDFVRLAQYFNMVHLNGGSPVEPQDVAIPVRHLEAVHAMLTLSDKVPYVFCHSRQRIHDVFEMIAIARGLTLDELKDAPSTFSIINVNSPLQYDVPMAGGIIEMARFGQPTLITPFTLAGAAAPVAMAGALAAQNAEALCGIVMAQLARAGAPVVYGSAATGVDMRSGAPNYGSPEFAKGIQISAQLARRYKMPSRMSVMTSSTAPDVQAALQSQMSLFAAVSGGGNLVMHAAGWLEGGLCSSFEKFVIDVEMLQNMVAYLDPIRVDAETLSLDEIAAVGPGGHFFAAPTTMATYETAFYQPFLYDLRNYGSWAEAGSQDTTQRAHRLYQTALREYRPPPMADDARAALDEFLARRKEEGGAPLE
jgi:trimethylamine--corrinoid protein Co-methyltransferase